METVTGKLAGGKQLWGDPDKFCVNCKHYSQLHSSCVREWTEPVCGHTLRMGCHKARTQEFACGAPGRGFEPKEAAKPRRMKGCGKSSSQCNHPCRHRLDHDEDSFCKTAGDDDCHTCQPIDAAPKPPEPQRPEPGEGWRLLKIGEETREGDEYRIADNAEWQEICSIGVDHHYDFPVRRRVEPVAQDAQDCPLCGSMAYRAEHEFTCCTNEDCGLEDCWLMIKDWNRLALREEPKSIINTALDMERI